MKLLCTLLFLLASSVVQAVDIKIVVPYPPSGSGGRVGRAVDQELNGGKYNFIIDYKPGANGTIAANYVAGVKNETVLMIGATALLAAPNIKYDVEKDFILVYYLGVDPLILVVNNSAGIKNFKDFIAHYKNKPAAYGSSGIGSASHIAAAIISQNNLNFMHVPYKTGANAMVDLLSNDLQFLFEADAVVGDFIATNKLTPLAVSNRNRLAKYPNIPTVRELGYNDYGVYRWFALVANRDADPEIIKYVIKRLDTPGFKRRLEEQGFDPTRPSYVNNLFQYEDAQLKQLFKDIKNLQ